MNLSKSALIFPGQGSQSQGMLEDYFNNKKIFSNTFDEAREVLKIDFKSLIFSDNKEKLSRTEITQPLMLISNIALWRELNLNPKSNPTKEEVIKSYKKIMTKIHPDISPQTARLAQICTEAKDEILKKIG